MPFDPKKYGATYYQKNKEKIKARVKQYVLENEEKVKQKAKEFRKLNSKEAVKRAREWAQKYPEKRKAYLKEWVKNNPKKSLIRHAKARCKKNGKEFSITENDFSIPELCPLLETPFKQTLEDGKLDFGSCYSLDRIDPTKGYVPGNVQVLSVKANLMKNDASKEELILFAKNILKMFGEAFE